MEEKEVLVKVEGLSKKFCKDLKTSLKYGVQDLFSNFTGNKDERHLRKKEFWALKNVNFELHRGECLGLIGHNGAGKSTLLKILNGLIKPDAGKVTIKGKVGALIELGAGFNPILTGRENIFNNGAVLGFTRKEIEDKEDEIIEFAEIREFIDMPVQHYSSGMKIRLGFAIAAQMEPDVLIIDEVLAVGDANFRAKCFNRMTILSEKCCMIFVSHSMPMVGRICNKGLLLEKGGIIKYGDIDDVIHLYMTSQNAGIKAVVGDTVIEEFKIELSSHLIEYGKDLEIMVSFILPEEVSKYILHYSILDQEMRSIYQSFSIAKNLIFENTGELTSIKFTIKNIDLTNGKYFINIGFIENDYKGRNICRYDGIAEFLVNGNKFNSFASIFKDTEWIEI